MKDLLRRGADPLATWDGKTAADYLIAGQRGLITEVRSTSEKTFEIFGSTIGSIANSEEIQQMGSQLTISKLLHHRLRHLTDLLEIVTRAMLARTADGAGRRRRGP